MNVYSVLGQAAARFGDRGAVFLGEKQVATWQELQDRALRLASSLPLCGCSVSPFVPGESTPLSAAPAGDIELTLNCMAALRLMRPGWVIPPSPRGSTT